MYLDVPWDQGTVPVKVDKLRLGPVIESKTVKVRDEAALLRDVLDSGTPSFRDFLGRNDGPILFVVNDATRPTPTRKVVEILKDELEGQDIRFIVATGAHRIPGEDDLEEIFGRDAREHFLEQIYAHDSRNPEELVHLGETSRGTPIWINRLVAETGRIVLLNSVEPHYFAGYTGGRKSLFPGLAGFETVESNHRLALHAEAATLALEGNPVHEDMMECMEALAEKDIYSIQMVLDRQHRIHSVHAGDLEASFAKAVEHADAHYVVDVDETYDVVVTAAPYPMDYDLYQSQKAIDNGARVLRPGGIVILVSKCRHGIGDETFFDLLAQAPTPAEVLERVKGEYVLGYHKAARLAHIGKDNEMWGITGIPYEDMEAAFIRPFLSVQAAVDAALCRKGPEARILFLMDGSLTVPRVTSEVGAGV